MSARRSRSSLAATRSFTTPNLLLSLSSRSLSLPSLSSTTPLPCQILWPPRLHRAALHLLKPGLWILLPLVRLLYHSVRSGSLLHSIPRPACSRCGRTPAHPGTARRTLASAPCRHRRRSCTPPSRRHDEFRQGLARGRCDAAAGPGETEGYGRGHGALRLCRQRKKTQWDGRDG